MKELKGFKCQITHYLTEGNSSFGYLFATITATSKAEAQRIAAANVSQYRSCKVEQVVDAAPGAVKGIAWIGGGQEW